MRVHPAAAAVAMLLWASPASADTYGPPDETSVRRSGDRWEIAFQGLNAIDAVQTCVVVSSGRGYEANPVLSSVIGRHPSCEALFGSKIVWGLVHWLIYDHIADRNPRLGRVFAQTSVVLQGSVVTLNMRLVF